MKKTKIFAMLLSLACATGFYSCSDDDDVKPALQNPTVTETAGAYNSLSFEWNEVANAVQYGYRLSDPDGIAVDAGVTHGKSVTIGGLQPATTYTLQVWAFASMDGDYSTPPAVTLTATTDALIKLASPAGLSLTSDNGYVYTAAWNAVENAVTYSYTVRDSEGALILSNTTQSTSVTVKDIENGNYVFYVFAVGHDGYSDGEAVSADFNVDKPEDVKPIWTVKGTYYSAQLDTSWNAVMDAYADGTYSIRSFYGVDGYNLDFAVDESQSDDMFSILNGEYVYDAAADYYTWQVPTGLSNPSILMSYPWYNYSYMEGDQSAGEVGIGNYYGDNYADWGYDVFTWPAEDSGLTVDDLVGTYNNHCYGWDSINDDWTWVEFDATDWQASVSKVNDSTIEVDGIYWIDCPVKGTVNFNEMTINFPVQKYYDGYYFADIEAIDTPVVGYINADGSISIPDFALWYDFGGGEADTYLEASCNLTKLSASGRPLRKISPKTKAKGKSIQKIFTEKPAEKPAIHRK